jgi:hypothetical protein
MDRSGWNRVSVGADAVGTAVSLTVAAVAKRSRMRRPAGCDVGTPDVGWFNGHFYAAKVGVRTSGDPLRKLR